MYHICHLDRSPFRMFQLQLCNRYYFIKVVPESFRIHVFWSFDTGFFRWMVPMEKPMSGIVSSIFWTAVYFVVILWRQNGGRFPSNQIRCVYGENRTRLWEDDVIGHVWGFGHVCGTGHVCESYMYICCEVFLMNIIVL